MLLILTSAVFKKEETNEQINSMSNITKYIQNKNKQILRKQLLQLISLDLRYALKTQPNCETRNPFIGVLRAGVLKNFTKIIGKYIQGRHFLKNNRKSF